MAAGCGTKLLIAGCALLRRRGEMSQCGPTDVQVLDAWCTLNALLGVGHPRNREITTGFTHASGVRRR